VGGEGSGRKPKTIKTRQIQETLTEAGVYGSKLIRDILRGTDSKHRKTKPVSMSKLRAAIEAINHAIGLPKAKIELKTDALTMKDIAELAVSFGQEADVLTVPLPKKSVEEKVKSEEN